MLFRTEATHALWRHSVRAATTVQRDTEKFVDLDEERQQADEKVDDVISIKFQVDKQFQDSFLSKLFLQPSSSRATDRPRCLSETHRNDGSDRKCPPPRQTKVQRRVTEESINQLLICRPHASKLQIQTNFAKPGFLLFGSLAGCCSHHSRLVIFNTCILYFLFSSSCELTVHV